METTLKNIDSFPRLTAKEGHRLYEVTDRGREGRENLE